MATNYNGKPVIQQADFIMKSTDVVRDEGPIVFEISIDQNAPGPNVSVGNKDLHTKTIVARGFPAGLIWGIVINSEHQGRKFEGVGTIQHIGETGGVKIYRVSYTIHEV